MKKTLLMLALGMGFLPSLEAASITLSNYSSTSRGIFGITDSAGVRLGGAGAKGVAIGRMNVEASVVAQMATEGDIAGLNAAFEVFATAKSPFDPSILVTEAEHGILTAVYSASTKLSDNEFGGKDIYVWIYSGNSSRTQATNILLAKLNTVFPTDSETLPADNAFVFLRPDSATFLLGSASGATHDYELPEGDGPLATLQMTVQIPVMLNEIPVATAGNLAVNRGATVSGQLAATDADVGDVLTYEVVEQPAKGTVTVATDGSYSYTSAALSTGNDSFTFRAYDGKDYSAAATVTITISDLPPEPEVPSITITSMDSGYVGTYYEFQVPVSNLPQGLPTSYAAKGLPAGLKLNLQTGLITGFPTATAENKVVTLSAKNAEGTSANALAAITIKAVPVSVVGTFVARVARNVDIGAGLGGRLDLTTTSKGTFTAKLMSGTVAYTGKGKLEIADAEQVEGDPAVAVKIDFIKKGFPTLVANLVLDSDDTVPVVSAFQLSGSLTDPESHSANVSGVRNTWTKLDKPTNFLGGYTYGLSIPVELENNPAIPHGYGFGALTVTDKGVGTFTGKTADGKVFTVASILGRQGHLPFYVALKTNAGSLVGMPKIDLPADDAGDEVLNSISAQLSWSKPDETGNSKSKERAYEAGFEPFNLALSGGLYRGAPVGGVVAGLTNVVAPTGTVPPANVRITFTDGGLISPVEGVGGDIAPFDFTIMNKKTTGVTQTVVVPKYNVKVTPNPNPNTVTFKLISKPAGYFSGTFNVLNADKKLVRKVTYQGTFVRQSNGTFQRIGYFLLPELPNAEGEKLTTTPLHSGWVELDPVTPAP